MTAPTKETATSTAHVTNVLRNLGYETILGGKERNRFLDGIRVQKVQQRYGPVPVTITSRRRTYDVQAEVTRITKEFAEQGLEISDTIVAADNKSGSFSVTRAFNKGKTLDGKNCTRISGRLWFIQIRATVVWAVETNSDDTDLRTVTIEGAMPPKYPFTIVAEMRRNIRTNGQKMFHWGVTVHGKKTNQHPGLTAAKEEVRNALLK